jgi:hypothetical protein
MQAQEPGKTEKFALALSGGGIRSATFALGFLQALAQKKLLARIGRLSTVSGGGYIGSFLCRLAAQVMAANTPPGASASGGRAQATGSSPTSEVTASSAAAWARTEQILLTPTHADVQLSPDAAAVFHPLQWLRENSRYLTPSGSNDLFNGLAYYLRGLLALHFNLAVMAILLCLLNVGLGVVADHASGRFGTSSMPLRGYLSQLLPAPCQAVATACGWQLIPSGWWLGAGMAFCISLAIGVAYGLVGRRSFSKGERRAAARESLELRLSYVAAVAMIVIFSAWGNSARHSSVVQSGAGFTLAAICLLALVVAWATRPSKGAATASMGRMDRVKDTPDEPVNRYRTATSANAHADADAPLPKPVPEAVDVHKAHLKIDQLRTDIQRRRLTWLLAVAMKCMLVAAAVALVDTLAMSLVQFHARNDSWRPWALPAAVYGTVLAAAWRWLMRAEPVDRKPSRFAGMAQTVLLLLALAVVAGLAVVYQVIAYELVFAAVDLKAQPLTGPWLPPRQPGLLIAAGLAITVLCIHGTPGFLNLSSFHNLYTARLKRAYLGAANPARLRALGRKTGAGGRDRSDAFVSEVVAGDEPASVDDYLSANRLLGIEHIINVTLNQRVSPTSPTLAKDRQGVPMCLAGQGIFVNSPQGPTIKPWFDLELMKRSPLSLGQWIAISGAAFSVGVGKETKPGYALLAFLANVRTAYWWRTPRLAQGDVPFGERVPVARKRPGEGTWTYLYEEALCRFAGIPGRYWYLSDGGHFDNTAVYELIRRKEKIIFASDDGADPCYLFDDLTNLIRRARIDFGAELVIRSAADIEKLGEVCGFGSPEDFRQSRARRAAMPYAVWVEVYHDNPGTGSPRDTLAEKPDAVVVFIKPALPDQLPGDLCHYAQTHPDFPQETTADQFFDEAQWESYRALGQTLVSRLLAQNIFSAIETRLWRTGRDLATNGG